MDVDRVGRGRVDDDAPAGRLGEALYGLIAGDALEIERNDRILLRQHDGELRAVAEEPTADNKTSPLWTDDYASLYSIMKQ